MDDGMMFYRSTWNTIFASRWTIWMAKLFGTRFEGNDSGTTVIGYYWRGCYYLTETRRESMNKERDK